MRRWVTFDPQTGQFALSLLHMTQITLPQQYIVQWPRTDMFMTQAWQCPPPGQPPRSREAARAACSVPDHDAVFVSLEPRRAGLLFAAVIHGRLRPPVAESETPVGIRQSGNPCARPRQGVLAGETEAPQIFDPELSQYFVQQSLGQAQESVGPMRLREASRIPAAVVQSKRGMAANSSACWGSPACLGRHERLAQIPRDF